MSTGTSRAIRLAIFAILAVTPGALFAQSTDSTIRVNVVGSNGQPLANSEITIIHEPTGSSNSYRASENGRIHARGQRVGGPYTVKFADGSQESATPISNLFTSVGQTITVLLRVGDSAIEEVVVKGTLLNVETNVGPGAMFSRDRLDSTPSLNRDISSMLQQDSRANFDINTGNLSIAGSNNRYNSLTVDGIRQNDDFGLNLNGSPTNRSPISLDAIESIALNIAPFDVEFGSFQGGNINVVTKSGTNKFHGTGFYAFSDDNFIGEDSDGDTLASPSFEDSVWGIRLGGPIVEDRLFFSLSYEESKTDTPFPFVLGNDDGITSANEIDVITQAQMDRALRIARDEYGYEGGTFDADFGTTDERLLIKLDWDINEDHRASFTYQNTDGTQVVDDFTFFRSPIFASPESQRFNSRQELTAWSAHLFSDWTEKLSTAFKYSSKKVATDNRSIGADGVGEAHIATSSPNGRSGVIHIGPDHFRHANDLDNDRTILNITATYALSDAHTITAGYERDQLETFNLFVPWSKGEFFYNSLDDYEAHRAARAVFGNAVSLNPADRAAIFESVTDVFYLQDEWLATDALTLTFGFRYETVTNDDAPVFNQNFLNRTGFRNDYNFDGANLFLPRIGFEYNFGDRTTLRGGVGKFGGGTPNVWLSNSYSQDGIRGNFRKQVFGAFDQNDGIPQALSQIVATVDAGADVDAVMPGTEIASVWKYNLGIKHNLNLSALGLGDDWQLQADVLITDVADAFIWSEQRQGLTGALAPDGRPIRTFGFSRDVFLSNTSSGGGQVYTLQMSRLFDTAYGRYNLYSGYTHQDIDEVNPGARFTSFDTYGSPAHIDGEDQLNGVTYAAHTETEHRVTFGVNWTHQLFGENTSSVTLSYVGRTGKNYSYTYLGISPFGGYGLLGDFNPKLLYIPTGAGDPLVSYGDNIDAQALHDFIDGENCLRSARGSILQRNTCQNDWVHRWDLRVSQDITIAGEHIFQVFLDVENLGNLLNQNWGRYEEFVYNTPLVSASLTPDGAQFVYDNFTSAPGKAVYRVPSVWKMQLGLRYSF